MQVILKLNRLQILLNNENHFELTVWIHKIAKIDKPIHIIGPCIIDAGAEIRPSAYIRGIIPSHSVVKDINNIVKREDS